MRPYRDRSDVVLLSASGGPFSPNDDRWHASGSMIDALPFIEFKFHFMQPPTVLEPLRSVPSGISLVALYDLRNTTILGVLTLHFLHELPLRVSGDRRRAGSSTLAIETSQAPLAAARRPGHSIARPRPCARVTAHDALLPAREGQGDAPAAKLRTGSAHAPCVYLSMVRVLKPATINTPFGR